jgi:hypothetical protein
LRICTWNMDHARGRSRDVDRVRLIDESNCDVLVLIETCDRVRPTSSAYAAEHSQPRPRCSEGERWTTVWTRLPVVRRLTAIDPLRTVALLLSCKNTGLLIYGTVLPWHSDAGDARADQLLKTGKSIVELLKSRPGSGRRCELSFPMPSLPLPVTGTPTYSPDPASRGDRMDQRLKPNDWWNR